MCITLLSAANQTLQGCPAENVSSDVCLPGYKIVVLDASLGYVNAVIHWCPDQRAVFTDPKECPVSIPNLFDAYFRTILNQCQGRRSCDGLFAVSGQSGLCFPNVDVTFTRIIYQCVLGK